MISIQGLEDQCLSSLFECLNFLVLFSSPWEVNWNSFNSTYRTSLEYHLPHHISAVFYTSIIIEPKFSFNGLYIEFWGILFVQREAVEALIQELPKFRLKAVPTDCSECPICLEEFHVGNEVQLTPIDLSCHQSL